MGRRDGGGVEIEWKRRSRVVQGRIYEAGKDASSCGCREWRRRVKSVQTGAMSMRSTGSTARVQVGRGQGGNSNDNCRSQLRQDTPGATARSRIRTSFPIRRCRVPAAFPPSALLPCRSPTYRSPSDPSFVALCSRRAYLSGLSSPHDIARR